MMQLAVQTPRRLARCYHTRCIANSTHNALHSSSRWTAACGSRSANRDDVLSVHVPVRHATTASSGGVFRLLTDEGRQILLAQRELVSKATELVRKVESTRSEVVGGARHGGSEQHPLLPSLRIRPNEGGARSNGILPDTLLSIVVAGEFNSGKSTLINALLDKPTLLSMGSLPTTDKLTVVCNSLPATADDEGETRSSVQYVVVPDAPLLNDVTIVDTPGTNTFRRHTEETHRVLPEADWVLFCTSADRPMPASEQALLQSIARFEKTVVVVVNKVDLLHASGGDHGAQEHQKVVDYVRRQATKAMSVDSEDDDVTVLAVSARYALAATALQSSSGVGRRSGLPELRDFLMNSLNAASKVKAKLSSPLGVTTQQMTQCLSILEEDRVELETDTATLRLLQLHMEAWRSDLDQSMRNSRRDMVQVLEHQSNRCHVLLRRVRWVDLLRMSVSDRPSLRAEWEATQLAPHSLDSPAMPDETTRLKMHVLELARDAADSIATKGRAQGQAVIEFLGKRPSARHSQSLVSSVTTASRFEDTRRALTHSMTNAVDRALSPNASEANTDKVSESERVLDRLQSSGQASAALSLAGLTTWTATSLQLLEPLTGVGVGIGLFAASGFALSAAHWRIASDYQHHWLLKSHELDQAIEAAFVKEATRMERRVEEGVTPYRLRVQSEQTRIERLTGECNEIMQRVEALRSRIDALG